MATENNAPKPQKRTTSSKRSAAQVASQSQNLSEPYVFNSDDDDDDNLLQSKAVKVNGTPSRVVAVAASPAPPPRPQSKSKAKTKTLGETIVTPPVTKAERAEIDDKDEDVEKSEDQDTESGEEEAEVGSEQDNSGTGKGTSAAVSVKSALKPALHNSRAALPQTNGVKRSADTQSASSKDHEEDSDSDESNKIDSQDSSIGEPAAKRTKPNTSTISTRPKASNTTKGKAALQNAPIVPYKPPPGYSVLSPSPSANHPFDLTILAQPQIQVYHLTAPSSFPLSALPSTIPASALKQTSSTKNNNNKPLLTHAGTPFNLQTVSAPDQPSAVPPPLSLLLPSAEGYVAAGGARLQCTRTLHIRPDFALHGGMARSAADGRAGGGKIARSQPEGLRMRYRPHGVGEEGRSLVEGIRMGVREGEIEGEEGERGEGGAKFRLPRMMKGHVEAGHETVGADIGRAKQMENGDGGKKAKKRRKEQARQEWAQEEQVKTMSEQAPLETRVKTDPPANIGEERGLGKLTNGTDTAVKADTAADSAKKKKKSKKEKAKVSDDIPETASTTTTPTKHSTIPLPSPENEDSEVDRLERALKAAKKRKAAAALSAAAAAAVHT